ncbi:hypothetical protein EVAR_96463_1 [Eumeta japonica]|uniref:Uncharacterized protein n=1 Tax=Eumeta variegata TaxID=151549 RepID=A0A4C1VUT1_EUMVA|nr:hypothetical protein EVAR_96463_1 [Eumeta japonica]
MSVRLSVHGLCQMTVFSASISHFYHLTNARIEEVYPFAFRIVRPRPPMTRRCLHWYPRERARRVSVTPHLSLLPFAAPRAPVTRRVAYSEACRRPGFDEVNNPFVY